MKTENRPSDIAPFDVCVVQQARCLMLRLAANCHNRIRLATNRSEDDRLTSPVRPTSYSDEGTKPAAGFW